MKPIELACLIEDNPANIFWMEEIINEVKFCEKLLVYVNGKKALDGLTKIYDDGEKLPDIIFLDLNMPIMDGWEFLDEFTKLPAPKKVIIYIVTSSINPEDVERSKHYEIVSNYIVKPISIQRLKGLLHDFTSDN